LALSIALLRRKLRDHVSPLALAVAQGAVSKAVKIANTLPIKKLNTHGLTLNAGSPEFSSQYKMQHYLKAKG
jgi:hypothetical protein